MMQLKMGEFFGDTDGFKRFRKSLRINKLQK